MLPHGFGISFLKWTLRGLSWKRTKWTWQWWQESSSFAPAAGSSKFPAVGPLWCHRPQTPARSSFYAGLQKQVQGPILSRITFIWLPFLNSTISPTHSPSDVTLQYNFETQLGVNVLFVFFFKCVSPHLGLIDLTLAAEFALNAMNHEKTSLTLPAGWLTGPQTCPVCARRPTNVHLLTPRFWCGWETNKTNSFLPLRCVLDL